MNDVRAEPSLTTVVGDLPCRDCAYNLRTLAWDGACPECGLPVQASRLPKHLRFGSYRSIRRTRLGIGLFAAAYALQMVTTIVLTVAMLCSSHFWNELHDRQSLPSKILRSLGYIYGYAPSAASVLYALAVGLIATPLAARRERCKPALAWTATGMAAVGLCGGLLSLAWSWLGTTPTGLWSAGVWAWLLGLLAFAAARPLALACLAGRLAPGHHRRLRLAVWLTVLLSALAVIGAGLGAVTVLASSWKWATSGVVFVIHEPTWLPSVSAISGMWDRYGEALCAVIMLAVLWVYARTLDAALCGPTPALAAK